MTGGPVCMLDINNLQLSDLDTTLHPLEDKHLSDLKQAWYSQPQESVSHNQFLDRATAWFMSTKSNDLQGWNAFPCVDVIMGCTHFIESLASKHKWNIQILGKEYAFFLQHYLSVRRSQVGVSNLFVSSEPTGNLISFANR